MNAPVPGIVGAGSWGTALGVLLAERGGEVLLWGHEADQIEEMGRTRENRRFLPGVALPGNLALTGSLADMARCDPLLVVTPSKVIREVAARLRQAGGVGPGATLVSCTKGIEMETGLRMSQILEEAFPENPVAALSGPSHAEEVGRRMPTAVVVGCPDEAVAGEVQRTMSVGWFRAYRSTDIAGIELGGALKNIFALGAGICDGLGMGDNSKAAFVTRSLAELIRLGVALGGRPETFAGLSGIGDLIVTCYSHHSRNRGVGECLGKGETLAEIQARMIMVAEGVPTALSAHECARRFGISTPILDAIRAVIAGERKPSEAVADLLQRELRPETDPPPAG
jgi:glycerol-3-phosphate dehydrogenase (NAD(P)+)